MALQITITDKESDITVTDSYHKVTGMLDDRLNGSMQIHVSVYKSATESASHKFIRQTGAPLIKVICPNDDYDTYFGTTVLDKANPVKQAYAYLKSIDINDTESNCIYDYKNDSTDI